MYLKSLKCTFFSNWKQPATFTLGIAIGCTCDM